MSRIKATEHAALSAIHDAEHVVDLTLASVGQRPNAAAFTELRRLAVFGQALLLVEGRARDAGVRPSDAAGALRRLVTPTAKEQRAAIEVRKGYLPAMRDRDGVLRNAIDAAKNHASEVASWLDRFVIDPSVETERGLRAALVAASEGHDATAHDGATWEARRKAARQALAAWDGGAS